MPVKVEAWNVMNGLGDPERSADILQAIDSHDADLVIFGEACAYKNEAFDESLDTLGFLGYNTQYVSYNDSDVRTDSHGLLVATRLPAAAHPARIASRTALGIMMKDPATNINIAFGCVHFDDRLETTRLENAAAAIYGGELLPTEGPRVLGGDMNSMSSNRVYCPSPRLADKLPVTSVRPDTRSTIFNRLARVYSVGSRASRMASGKTYEYILAAGFRDADLDNLPTMPSHKPRFQLDHIFHSSELRALDFERHDHDASSDHRAISATLES